VRAIALRQRPSRTGIQNSRSIRLSAGWAHLWKFANTFLKT